MSILKPKDFYFSEYEKMSYLHQVWQQQMLGEIGITRWIGQNTTVLEYSNLIETPKNLVNPVNADTYDRISTLLVGEQDNHHNNHGIEYFAPNHANPLAEYKSFQNELNSDYVSAEVSVVNHKNDSISVPSIIVSRFCIQALVYGKWLLIVDEEILQTDAKQQALWKQIAISLQSSIHSFNFPLLENNHMTPNTRHVMSNRVMAKAAFEGFAFLVSQGSDKILASLTPLPNYFDGEEVQQHLPTLNQMLQNAHYKRKLWHYLKTPINE